MGIIFSPERITAGRIPKDGAHQKAGRYILAALGDMQVDMPAFRGGMIYGSTTTRPNRRSDLDVFTVFDTAVTGDEIALLSDLYHEVDAAYDVKPEPNLVTTCEHPAPEDNQIDSLFWTHLTYTEQTKPEWVIGSPTAHMRQQPLTKDHAVRIARSYASYKERRFTKAELNKSTDPNIALLQRAFELPSAMARKVIGAIDYSPYADVAQVTREQLELRAHKLLLSAGSLGERALSAHTALSAANNEYNTVLEAAIDGNITATGYAAWLTELQRPSMSHARTLSAAWKSIIARQQDDIQELS